jgi:DNA mismatch repair ATPase MutL
MIFIIYCSKLSNKTNEKETNSINSSQKAQQTNNSIKNNNSSTINNSSTSTNSTTSTNSSTINNSSTSTNSSTINNSSTSTNSSQQPPKRLRLLKEGYTKLSKNFSKPFKYISPVVFKNNIYFINEEGIIALDLNNRISNIYNVEIPIGDTIGGGLFVNENALVFCSFDGQIYLLELNLNKIKIFKHKKRILSSPVLKGNKIYFIDSSATLVELNIQNEQLREFVPKNISQEIFTELSAPVVTDNYVIYGGTLGQLFFIDLNTFKATEVKIPYETKSHLCNKPLLKDDFIVFCSDSITVCIDLKSLKIKWKFDCGSNINPILFEDNIVIAKENILIFLDSNGVMVNSFEFYGPIVSSMIVKNTLCVTDLLSNIYILNENHFIINRIPLKTSHCPVYSSCQTKDFLSFLDEYGDLHIFSIHF